MDNKDVSLLLFCDVSILIQHLDKGSRCAKNFTYLMN